MKIKKLTLTFAILAITTTVFGQDYAFKVLANKGANEVKTGNSWEPLKTGASLRSTDELKLADNAYIGLVHKTGRPMEVKQPGSHKISDLEKKVGVGSSVLNKYTDFILSSNSAEAKKNRLGATGAVQRKLDDATPIKLVLPDNQHSGVYNSKAVVNWNGTDVAGPYVVTIKNMFDDEVAKMETPESKVQIDLSDPKFASENAILVEVASKANASQKSTQHLIKKLPPAEQEKVKVSLNEILGEVQEPTALNHFIMASFFEQSNLLIDAIASYEEAVKLAPDVPSYQEAYDEFLIRNGFVRK